MNNWFEIVLAVFSSVLASSGLWAFLSKKAERKDHKRDMLIGLAHDRILRAWRKWFCGKGHGGGRQA